MKGWENWTNNTCVLVNGNAWCSPVILFVNFNREGWETDAGKGCLFSIKGIQKGELFSQNGTKRVKGWTLEWNLPVKKKRFWSIHSPPPTKDFEGWSVLLIEFNHKIPSLLQTWGIRLQVTKNIKTVLLTTLSSVFCARPQCLGCY